MQHDSVLKAIQIAGSLGGLADLLGVSSPTVHEWKSGKRRVPLERCVQIEQATHGAVTCEALRPDVNWAYIRGTAPHADPAPEPAPAPAPPPEEPPEPIALPTRAPSDIVRDSDAVIERRKSRL